MSWFTKRFACWADDDAGIALILVIGVIAATTALATAIVVTVQGGLRSARAHDNFESAVAVAENGIDATLAQLQQNSAYTACGCTASSFASASAERSWARSTIMNLAASGSSLLQSDGQGQYLSIRPSNRQTVYSMGWVPSYSAYATGRANAKARLLKAEYIFAPYAPTNAVLTQGDLNFSGSVVVNSAIAGTTAPVHSNGSITSTNSSLNVSGDVTASGSYSVGSNATVGSGSGGATPLQDVPPINPRDFYNNPTLVQSYGGTIGASGYTGAWYDLCDDGYVHARNTSDTTPCMGSILNVTSGTPYYPYRGWNFNPPANGNAAFWSMDEASSPYEGIYYAYGTDVVINGKTHNGDPPWHASILAEPKINGSPCNKVGGTITWKLTDIANYITGTVIVAGHDFIDTANNDAGDGLFAAADQVYMQTSSANLTGWVVAGDQCPPPSGSNLGQGPSNIQGVTVHFDNSAEVPITGIIRTTLWLEYPSN